MSASRPPVEGLPPDDVAALEAFRTAARMEAPTPFQAARAARDLEAALDVALDAHAHALARWTPGRVLVVAALAAVVGGGVALSWALSTRGEDSAEDVPLVSRAETRAVAPQRPAVMVGEPAVAVVTPPAPGVPDAQDVVASAPGGLARGPRIVDVDGPAPTLPAVVSPVEQLAEVPLVAVGGWRGDVEALLERGDGNGAAQVAVGALALEDSAAPVLALIARRYPQSLAAVDDELARLRSSEAMRVRCELRLLRLRDVKAVEACRAFAQEHPEHPGARTLSFAAGRLAEDTLGDLALAEEEYSRALLLSPFSGLPATDALLARARVRAARGNVDEARADLRLYLHNEPGADRNAAVRDLVSRLKLQLP